LKARGRCLDIKDLQFNVVWQSCVFPEDGWVKIFIIIFGPCGKEEKSTCRKEIERILSNILYGGTFVFDERNAWVDNSVYLGRENTTGLEDLRHIIRQCLDSPYKPYTSFFNTRPLDYLIMEALSFWAAKLDDTVKQNPCDVLTIGITQRIRKAPSVSNILVRLDFDYYFIVSGLTFMNFVT